MLERIRRAIPGVSLRTSFIVGFPGETEADFRVLCGFVRAARFDWLGVFAYSDEETAESFHLEGKVDEQAIARRRDELMAIQREISAQHRRAALGQQLTAMLEGPSRESELVWEARTEGMAPEIDGKVYVTDLGKETASAQPGQMATVEITEAHHYDLVARVVELHPARGGGLTRAARPNTSSPDAGTPLAAPPAARVAPAQDTSVVVRIATGAPLRVLS